MDERKPPVGEVGEEGPVGGSGIDLDDGLIDRWQGDCTSEASVGEKGWTVFSFRRSDVIDTMT